jgi:hypothetical protein
VVAAADVPLRAVALARALSFQILEPVQADPFHVLTATPRPIVVNGPTAVRRISTSPGSVTVNWWAFEPW